MPPGDDHVPSPCVEICTLDPETGECLGCGRTVEEIAGWLTFSNAQKRAVWERLSGQPRPHSDENAS